MKRPYNKNLVIATEATRVPFTKASEDEDTKFSVYSYALNRKPGEDAPEDQKKKGGIVDDEDERHSFPGNVSPEGYFYSPFYEVTIKELDDEISFVNTRRINFLPESASVETETVTFYDPEIGVMEDIEMYNITVISPVNYDFLIGVPFAIYDVFEDRTYRGHLSAFNTVQGGCEIVITTKAKINEEMLNGSMLSGKSGYFISKLEENAPEYAEYVPASERVVWRDVKKMSELSSDSPIYNMPFTNGREYVQKNVNVYVRRQDPHSNYNLFRPSLRNPLRRYQVEGEAKLDFDKIKEIIDTLVDAC